MANKKTRHLGIFSTKDFELLKSCSTLTLLAPNKGGLEVSKNVQYVSVAQGAEKLELIKHGVINCVYRISGHPQNLAKHNFAAL